MSTDRELFAEMRSLMLQYIENIPLKGDEFDHAVWTREVGKLFGVFGGHEIIKRPEVFESLKACVAKNACNCYVQHTQSECCPSETASPHALAYAVLELDFNKRLKFSEKCPKEAFFKQYFKPKLLDILFEQLYPQESVPSFLFT